jgi:hypothetical protein
MRRFLSAVVYGLVVLIGVLALGEAALRVFGPKDPVRLAQMRIIPRMWSVWNRAKPPDPFSPPYRAAFANSRSDDEGRLRNIVTRMTVPQGRWNVPDFLRDPAQGDQIISKVSLDAHGFRGMVPRKPEKPPKTMRILVLGSYQAFGHGVNDWETYSFYLEKMLNRTRPEGMDYQVWNLGRPGASAVMGWAQLSQRLLRYEPDLIIWDFGFNDLATKNRASVGDHLMKVPALKKGLRGLATNPWLAHSRLLQHFFFRLFASDRKKNMEEWDQVHERLVALSKEKRITVILLRHGSSGVPPEGYTKHLTGQAPVYFLDTTAAVQRTKARPEEVDEFWSKPNYLNEVGAKREDVGNASNAIYRTDALHYNRFGHRAIARLLYEKITGIMRPASSG